MQSGAVRSRIRLHFIRATALFGYSGFHLREKTYRLPQAVPGAIVYAGNTSLIPAYLLALFIQVQTAVGSVTESIARDH
jgi:hypothetical protein